MTPKERKVCLALLNLFRIDGKPAGDQASEGQLNLFYQLVYRKHKRLHIEACTQYGKSLFTALACIVISTIQEETVAVVAPTNEKAKIIMRYYIQHIGDNPIFYSQLERNTKLERLRQEESKERITLRNGGGIFVVSVQVHQNKRSLEAAMGYGAKNVIEDEACLIPDNVEATIFRMVAGQGKDAFYCKIGNPFYDQPPYTHFWQSRNANNYKVIRIDYQQALKEGRYTEEFVEEARKKPNFRVLFECEFPEHDLMDQEGWTPLLSRIEIERAMDGAEHVKPFGVKVFGADPADTGANESVIVLRHANLANIHFASSGIDALEFANQCVQVLRDEEIRSEHAFLDKVGIGATLPGIITQNQQTVRGVNVAEKPSDVNLFTNKRAEAFWQLRRWIKEGGKLTPDEKWYQLTNVKYKADNRGRLRIMSKDEMIRHGIPSPDVADALMLTFYKPTHIKDKSFEEIDFQKRLLDRKRRQFKQKTQEASFYG